MSDYTDEPQNSRSDVSRSDVSRSDISRSDVSRSDFLQNPGPSISLPNARAKFEPLRIREVENFKFPYTFAQVGIAIFITLIIVVIISKNLKD